MREGRRGTLTARAAARVATAAAVAAALTIVGVAPVRAAAPAVGADPTVVRVTHGARTVEPGGAVLLSATVVNRGTEPTSAAAPLTLRAPGLPAGVTLRPGDSRQPGLTCADDTCTYTRPVVPGVVVSLPLVAEVGRSVAPGTTVSVDLGVGEPDGTDDRSAPVRFRVGRSAPDLVRWDVRAPTEPVVGQRTVLHGRALAVAGRIAARIAVTDVVPARLLRAVSARGPGWTCDRSSLICRYRAALPVGTSTPPLAIRGVVRPDVRTTPVPHTARGPRHGTVTWRPTVTVRGDTVRPQTSRVAVRTAAALGRTTKPARGQVPDWTRRAHLEAAVTARGDVRPGGAVRLEVEALHNGVGHTRGRTRTDVRLSRGLAVTQVRDGAWRCRTSAPRALSCSLARAIRAAAPAPRILVDARADAPLRAARARAEVAWRTPAGRHRDTAATPLTVLPPLGVRARVSDRHVLAPARGSGVSARKAVMLRAAINGTDQRVRPAHRWRQVAGPKVRWLGPRVQTHGQVRPTARVAVPQVKRPRTLAFRVTAAAHGARATDTVRLRVVPRSVARFAPRRTPGVTVPIRVPDRRAWTGQRVRPALTQHVGRPGATRVTAGTTRRVTATVSGRGKLRHRWTVLSGPKRLLRGPADGTSVRVRAPKHPGLYLVGLRTSDRRGRHVHRAEVIRVVTPTEARANELRSAVAPAAAASGFCTAWQGAADGQLGAPIALGAGSLTLGTVTRTGSGCADPAAAIAFTAGSISLGRHDFVALTGSLTATGVALTAGTYQLPTSWAQAMADLDLPDSGLTFQLPASAAVTAPWSGADLGAPAGALTLDEFLFLNLPTGWRGTTTVSFTPGATEPLGLDASATDPTGGDQSGSVEVTGTAGLDGRFSLSVQAADVAVISGADGSQATVSGGGSLALATAGGSVTYDVSASLDGPLQVFPSFTLRRATADWTNKGLALTGAGSIAAAGDSVPVGFSGKYRGNDTWSLAATQKGPWQTPDVTVSGLAGTVAYAKGALSFSVTGQASGLDLPDGVTADTVSATVTNVCPTPANGCSAGDLRLAVDVTGTVSFDGSTADYSGSIDADLTTMDVDFDAQVTGSFGPAGLPLTDVTLTVGQGGGAGTCATTSGGSGTTAQFTATMTDPFSGDDLDVIGELGPAGYCFAAELTDFSPTGSPGTDNSFDDVTLIYAGYDTTVSVPGQTPIPVAAGTLGLYGSFTAPAGVSSTLGGLAGSGTFSAVVTDGSAGLGFTGTVEYTLAQPLYPTGSPGSADAVQLDDVTLTVDVAAAELDIDLVADGAFTTGSSTIPLSVGVDVDLATLSFGFSATAAGNGAVPDAFGYDGLTVDNLAIAGSLGGADSLAFAADVALPESWVGSLGVQPDTDLSLVIDISATPCFQFAIGQANSATTAIDVLNEGVLVADYANIVLAPVGCQFADVDLAAGFALDFDGLIAGDPVAFAASLDLGGSGFALDASLSIGELTLGGATTLTDTALTFDIDPSQDLLDIAVAADVDVAGTSLAIAGSYDRTGPGTVTASFTAATSGQVSVAGFEFDDATVALRYSSTPSSSALSFALDGTVSVLGQSVSGGLALTAQNGTVVTASGNVYVVADFGVASVAGPLQFSYRTGQGMSATFGPGTIDAFGVDFEQVNGSLQADGSYSVSAGTSIPWQNASAADAWLYDNEGGEFNTIFSGWLWVTVSGTDGQSPTVGYQGSQVAVYSEWAEHTWDSYGDYVPVPVPGDGCPAPFVAGDGWWGVPAVSFWLNPVAVENASTGDSDDDTDYCLGFGSEVW